MDKVVERLYHEMWGERQNMGEPTHVVRGLEEEVERVLPEVKKRVASFTEQDLRCLAADFIIGALEAEAKKELAMNHLVKIISMYDDKSVSNKRAKMRKLHNELRSILGEI